MSELCQVCNSEIVQYASGWRHTQPGLYHHIPWPKPLPTKIIVKSRTGEVYGSSPGVASKLAERMIDHAV